MRIVSQEVFTNIEIVLLINICVLICTTGVKQKGNHRARDSHIKVKASTNPRIICGLAPKNLFEFYCSSIFFHVNSCNYITSCLVLSILLWFIFCYISSLLPLVPFKVHLGSLLQYLNFNSCSLKSYIPNISFKLLYDSSFLKNILNKQHDSTRGCLGVSLAIFCNS